VKTGSEGELSVAPAVRLGSAPRGVKLPLMFLPVKDGDGRDVLRAVFLNRQRKAGRRIDAAAGKDHSFQNFSLLSSYTIRRMNKISCLGKNFFYPVKIFSCVFDI
jgi:hypothetical protein